MNFVKKYFWISHLIFAVTVFGLGFWLGGMSKTTEKVENIAQSKSYTMIAKTQENIEEDESKKEPTVSSNASIVYIRKYAYDNSTNVSEDKVTSEHIGKTKEEIKKMFDGWDIVSFSKDRIVLSSTVDYYPQGAYLLSTYINEYSNEVVSVYSYDAEGNRHLYQIFDTPITVFDDETIENLRKGIPAKSQDELEKILQDYE